MKACIIVASGLQLGYLGCYGNEWISTPTLDRLASDGVVFDQHFADEPGLAGARRSWRTSRYSFPLPGGQPPFKEEASANLFTLLRQHGIRTELISDHCDCLTAENSGWEHIRYITSNNAERGTLDQVLEAAIALIDQLARCDNWLLKIDLATLVPPWKVPEEFGKAYAVESEGNQDESEEPTTEAEDAEQAQDAPFLQWQRDYAAAVTYLDAGLDQLFKSLDERFQDVLVLVTTDCGQRFAEASPEPEQQWPWLREELFHLPLLLRLPGKAVRRIAALTQPVDLLPTLFDFFALPAPDSHGSSLLPLVGGNAKEIRSYACAGLRVDDSMEWVLRTPEWSFVLPVYPIGSEVLRKPTLFVKPDDRWDVNNVIQHHLELTARLEQVLKSFVEATWRPGPLCPPALEERIDDHRSTGR